MARHYTTRDFFRQMPNELLARYFAGQKLFEDIDFAAVKETKPDELFEAWMTLPDEDRNTMDAVFAEIFEMSCEKGAKAIIDEAEWHMDGESEAFAAFVDRLSALPNHYHRAMVTYLEHPECWKGATRFYHADTLPYWRKRKGLGHREAAVDDASIANLADLIRRYFHQTEGRGNNCVVEPLRRGDLDYFFAYPEDYSQQAVEWVDGSFERRPHNPAFEVVFVYSKERGDLDLNFRSSYKAIEPLQALFATAILKLPDLPPDPKDDRVYDLNVLRDRAFEFSFDAGEGIEDVVVRKLRLSSRFNKGERITLERNTAENPNAVYDLLDKLGAALPLNLYNVTQVELSASMVVDADKPPKAVRISITHPNSCSLKYDERDLKLRAMLEASGIEPKPAEPDDQAA